MAFPTSFSGASDLLDAALTSLCSPSVPGLKKQKRYDPLKDKPAASNTLFYIANYGLLAGATTLIGLLVYSLVH